MNVSSKAKLGSSRALQVLAGALLLFAASTCTSTCRPARADQALVVGINTYPNLRQGSLMGCVNDATDMDAQLKKRGFTTTLLTNAQATKVGISAALDAMKTRVKPNERFVFFYAGHGTRAAGGGSSLLPTDAQEGNENFDYPAALLYEKLGAIPARSRTALLDSCFAGGMMRSKSLKRPIVSRFYRRAITAGSRAGDAAGAKDLVMVRANHPQPNAPAETTPGPICYFVAAKPNEEAGEDDIQVGARRERHGIFTFNLLQEMDKLPDLRLPWNTLSRPVISGVVQYMEDLQHPQISGSYLQTQIFEASADTPPVPVPTNTPVPAPTATPVPTVTPTPVPEPPKATPQLQLAIAPKTFSETAGPRAALGTITRNTPSNQALFITLASSDTGKVTVPRQLVIPTGKTSVQFYVVAVDNTIVDGPRQAVITASAPGHVADSATLTVTDNDVLPPPTPTPRPTIAPTPVPTLVPKPLETNLQDELNADHADSSKVLLTMEPDRSAVRLGEQFSFRAQVGAPGYLVIIERGTSGKLNLIYPLTGKVDDAYLARPARIPVDTEYAYTADAAGNERLKALLFGSRQRANALLSKLPQPDSKKDNSFEGLSRNLKLVRTRIEPNESLFTSDLMFAVLPREGEAAKPEGLPAP